MKNNCDRRPYSKAGMESAGLLCRHQVPPTIRASGDMSHPRKDGVKKEHWLRPVGANFVTRGTVNAAGRAGYPGALRAR